MVSYFRAGAGVITSLASGGSAGDAAGDTFSGVDNLIGSDYGDTLTGDGAANVLDGAAGGDTIKDFQAGAGGDVLDLSRMTSGDDPVNDTISNIVQLFESDGNTIVRVDSDGSTGGQSFTDVTILEGLVVLDLNTLETDGNIVWG